MPPPFRSRDLATFAAELEDFDFGDIRLTGVHVHHTYRPDHGTYKSLGGARCVEGMWRYHTASLGWSDIAQHESIGPDGLIWSGRDWLARPASSRGFNGTRSAHPFMFEMIGDFETVADGSHDQLTTEQYTAAIGICAVVCNRFDLVPAEAVKFHRELAEKWKSCPGNLIDKDQWVSDVENFDLEAMSLAGAITVHGAQVQGAPAAASYTVQPGDGLWGVARAHGLTFDQLLDLNGLQPDSVIHPGDTLILPSRAG